MKKILFIDRDGTLVREPEDLQLDAMDKLQFLGGVFQVLARISREMEYELVMVTNQDGLGTPSFPEEDFWKVQDFIINTLKNEGVSFREVLIDRSFPEDNLDTRKPRTGLLKHYLNGDYDLAGSYVIGDRLTDMELASNLGAGGILIGEHESLGRAELSLPRESLEEVIRLRAGSWNQVYTFLRTRARHSRLRRTTEETDIEISLDLDGSGVCSVLTGIGFFDHMLAQLARHGQVDLDLRVRGDLQVDEHHTIEDTGIALGEAFAKALENKMGIERYGFCLPMDDCLARVAIDFGGRSWLVWDAEFRREYVGKMPTEMFSHFFRSFCDGAKANLNICATGTNEHHKIESIFKAFARAIRAAIRQDPERMILPSTKGLL